MKCGGRRHTLLKNVLLTLDAHAQRGWVCLCVCVCLSVKSYLTSGASSDVVSILIRNGATANLASNVRVYNYYTIYAHIASQDGHSDVVNTLMRNGADLNLACNVWRYNTIHSHCMYNCRRCSHKAYRSLNSLRAVGRYIGHMNN